MLLVPTVKQQWVAGSPGVLRETCIRQGQQKRAQAEQQKPLWSLSETPGLRSPHKKSSQRTNENARQ